MGSISGLHRTASQTKGSGSSDADDSTVVDSLSAASLLAFTGGALDAFLWLNHGQVFAGVMSGNVVLCGAALFNHSLGGALHYAWPVLAYICGILLITIFQRHVTSKTAQSALLIAVLGFAILSLLPHDFPEDPYIFLVVLLTGFTVGIARKVDKYSYNATVLTGTLRDGTTSLYEALNPAARTASLEESKVLWLVMLSFLVGAAGGGLLGRHVGNHALWLPTFSLILVLVRVSLGVERAAAPSS